MLASHSVENIIAQQMEKYGMSAMFLGDLCVLRGIPASQTRLSAALRGAKPLLNEVGRQVRELVREIAEYVDSTETPVLLVDAAQVNTILKQRREAKEFFEAVKCGEV